MLDIVCFSIYNIDVPERQARQKVIRSSDPKYKGAIFMKIKFHNLSDFTSYVAKNKSECRSDLDKSLWDMHQQVFDRCWCCGETVAEKI